MGIHNIQFLRNPEMGPSTRKVQDYIEAKRTVEHRAGKHPVNRNQRDCPLCRSGK